MAECKCAVQRSEKCALTCHISVDRFRACVKMVATGKSLWKAVILLHYVGFWTSFDASHRWTSEQWLLIPLHRQRLKVDVHVLSGSQHEVQSLRSANTAILQGFGHFKVPKWQRLLNVLNQPHIGYREKDLLVLPLPLRKLLPVSLQIIADAANELEYLDVILTGWNSAPLDSRKNVCIQ